MRGFRNFKLALLGTIAAVTAVASLTTLRPAVAQDTAPATTAVPAAPPAPTTGPAPAMWVVRDADTTIYLFGTVHLLPPGLVWRQDQLRAAFDAADTLVKELPADPTPEEMAGLMFPAGLYLEGPGLPERIGAEKFAQFKAAMAPLGMPDPMLERLRPWLAGLFLSVSIMMETGLDPESGVEKVIDTWNREAGKPRLGLETAEQQIGFFRDMPEEAALATFFTGLDQLGEARAFMDTMVGAWASGDTATLDRVVNEAMAPTPELRAVILGARNARWAKWIDARMDTPGTVLVAVGAGHLVGHDSVQVFLEQEGHVAERVAP